MTQPKPFLKPGSWRTGTTCVQNWDGGVDLGIPAFIWKPGLWSDTPLPLQIWSSWYWQNHMPWRNARTKIIQMTINLLIRLIHKAIIPMRFEVTRMGQLLLSYALTYCRNCYTTLNSHAVQPSNWVWNFWGYHQYAMFLLKKRIGRALALTGYILGKKTKYIMIRV